MVKDSYVYIMANATNKVLYVGMTNDLVKRVYQHKNKVTPGFTSKYNVNKLVYYEAGQDIRSIIEREKQIKRWRCEKKETLIKKMNPEWKDLYNEI